MTNQRLAMALRQIADTSHDLTDEENIALCKAANILVMLPDEPETPP
jgi:hypothetical protein